MGINIRIKISEFAVIASNMKQIIDSDSSISKVTKPLW